MRSARPWRCLLLAIDPGETSGWALYANGKLVQWGWVDVHHGASVEKVIAAALQLAAIATLPAVLLLERPYSRRTLGPSRTIWAKAWAAAGASERRIARAWPSRWRSQLFGRGMGSAKQEDARANEQLGARAEIAAGSEKPIESVPHDVAAAICMGKWGTHAEEVGKVLPAGVRARSA